MWGLLYMLHRSQSASLDATASMPLPGLAPGSRLVSRKFQIGPIGVRVQQGPKLPPL
jgi:hypothetical protein